jgi:HD-GYP domain-containing protein (c-di-GMP phosphodiesterase class II)
VVKIEANLISTLASFSRTGDIKNLSFLSHAERVAHTAFRLGKMLTLSPEDLVKLVLSALLHDIGIMTDEEQLWLADLEPTANKVAPHCKRGYSLLQSTRTFSSLAQDVLEHHDFYSPSLRIIPAILHVADRVDMILKKNQYSLTQLDTILSYFVNKSGYVFHPDVVDALQGLGKIPSFWLDLEFGHYHYVDNAEDFQRILSIDELEELAKLMTVLVDSKSPFTGHHSRDVTNVAGFLANKLNMPEGKVRMLRIAGLLHDIGKLAIPDEILMYPGPLNREQRAIMKQHTYHSYHLIRGIGPGADALAGWAAFHHERLNGTGYPFGLRAPDLDQESRLMAVADITESLLESRPYREGMNQDKVRQILHNNVQAGHIDSELTDLAIAHLDDIMRIINKSIRTA